MKKTIRKLQTINGKKPYVYLPQKLVDKKGWEDKENLIVEDTKKGILLRQLE